MCEVREQALTSITCKADAVALCVTCDSDIHSANPLARRHERVLVEPFFDSAELVIKSRAPLIDFLMVPTNHIRYIDSSAIKNSSTNLLSWLLASSHTIYRVCITHMLQLQANI
nr:zinc finger protein constans-like 4 [Quercus suber]